MQRPPSDKRLPLAPVSPIHDAINRISAKQVELTKLRLSPDQQSNLTAFVERAFTASALGLTGVDSSGEQIAALQKTLATEPPAPSGPERKIQSTLASIQVLESAVDRGAPLTPDLLLRIHDPFRDAGAAQDQQD